jgi:hypothetical protein
MSGFGHMGWMNGWGMGFGMILWLAIAALIIAGLVLACSFTAYSGWSASFHGS